MTDPTTTDGAADYRTATAIDEPSVTNNVIMNHS
jgi:hypothetical protein